MSAHYGDVLDCLFKAACIKNSFGDRGSILFQSLGELGLEEPAQENADILATAVLLVISPYLRPRGLVSPPSISVLRWTNLLVCMQSKTSDPS